MEASENEVIILSDEDNLSDKKIAELQCEFEQTKFRVADQSARLLEQIEMLTKKLNEGHLEQSGVGSASALAAQPPTINVTFFLANGVQMTNGKRCGISVENVPISIKCIYLITDSEKEYDFIREALALAVGTNYDRIIHFMLDLSTCIKYGDCVLAIRHFKYVHKII